MSDSISEIKILEKVYSFDGIFFYCQMEGDDSSGLEVKVLHSGENNFRVEAGGLQTDVTLAHYIKVCP